MKYLFHLINSKLSWRLFSLFFIAAIIPILILAAASYMQISKELTTQSSAQIRDMTKDLGMDIYEKVRYLSSEFKLLVNSGSFNADRAYDEYLQSSHSTNLFKISPDKNFEFVSGQTIQLTQEFIETAATSTLTDKVNIIADEDDGTRLYMLIKARDETIFGSELSVTDLWNTEYLNTLEKQVCILSPDSTPLYCNKTPDQSWLGELKQRQKLNESGYFEWQGNENLVFSSYWTIFLAPHFSFPKWTVAISVSHDKVMQPVSDFQITFIQVLLVTLGLVILLSTVSISRNLNPLSELVSATQNIAKGDFSQRIDLHSENEFHELGEALNTMAMRLGSQFNSLTILADLDSSFQRSDSLEGITKSLMTSIKKCEKSRLLTIGCINRDEKKLLIWKSQSDPDDRGFSNYDAIPLQGSFNLPHELWKGNALELHKLLPMLGKLKATEGKRLVYFPAVRDNVVVAFVVVEVTETYLSEADEEIIPLLAQIVDLFGIKLEAYFLGQNLHFMAHHDSLTGLPNRGFILDSIERLINEMEHPHKGGAVILIDLNKFKSINDTQGHAAGDELLIQVARRFKNVMRQNDIISRLSGDEFIAVLTNIPDNMAIDIATQGAKRLNKALSDPFKIGEIQHDITASMGIAFYPKDGSTPAEVLQAADAAMYSIKSDPSAGYYGFYSEELHNKLLNQIEIERALIPAIKNETFVLYYQPVFDKDKGQIVSAEALVRWEHAEKGIIRPDIFISIAEKSRLIVDLGKWVVRQACEDLANWKKSGFGLKHISVNVSARQLNNDQFPAFIQQTLEENQLEPGNLVLEVTETAIMDNYETGKKVIDRLRKMGLKISIDDFGTGFASLSYLKLLPADYLKIDRIFIMGLPADTHDGAVIESLASLATTFDLTLIAEGVETTEQADYLHDKGVNYLQGYLYSKPLPPDQFQQLLN